MGNIKSFYKFDCRSKGLNLFSQFIFYVTITDLYFPST